MGQDSHPVEEGAPPWVRVKVGPFTRFYPTGLLTSLGLRRETESNRVAIAASTVRANPDGMIDGVPEPQPDECETLCAWCLLYHVLAP